jgi:hypothetical protein
MNDFRHRTRAGHNSGRHSKQVSQVTTGKRCFVDLGDGRSAWARRWGDLVVMHAADLGGFELLSEAQISICKRVSTLECELESLEGRKSAGMPVDIEVYGRIASRLCRMLELIGIKRLTKPLDPTSDLAKALEAYPAKPIDDDGDGGDDEPLAIEEAVEPTDPG